MNPEFEALISLMDDPDAEVRSQVSKKILELGDQILPILKDSLESVHFDSTEGMERIAILIDNIETEKLITELTVWASSDSDLLKGMWIANITATPDLEISELNKEIERIKLEVWLDLRYDLTALEKVNILNHVFFKRFGFKGNKENFHLPDNSFLNRVIRNKKGNPISLAVLYALVAQRLFIPVYGVNLPQHFILAYLDVEDLPPPGADSKGLIGDAPQGHDVLFYINPFNEGAVFGKKHIEDFLKQGKIETEAHHFYPCSNKAIIHRVFRNLINAYSLKGSIEKVQKYQKIADAIRD